MRQSEVMISSEEANGSESRLLESPVKVLFPYVGDSVGGSHISSLTLVRHLVVSSRVAATVAILGNGCLSEYLTRNRLAFGYFPSPVCKIGNQQWRLVISSLLTAPRLARWLRARGFQIVHTNDFRMHVLWSLACRLAGVKHIMHLRNLQKPSVRFRILGSTASRLVVVSATANRYLGPTFANKTSVILDPIDENLTALSPERARSSLLKKTNGPKSDFLIGWAANFRNLKRPHDLIELALKLREAGYHGFKILMFGNHDTPSGQNIREAIDRHSLGGEIILAGWNDAFPVLLTGLDLFISTSSAESFGRTVREAVLAGTRVVATDIEAHVELLRNESLADFFPVGDINQLTKVVVQHLTGGPSKVEPFRSSAAAVRRSHGPERHALTVTSMYRHLLS